MAKIQKESEALFMSLAETSYNMVYAGRPAHQNCSALLHNFVNTNTVIGNRLYQERKL